MSPTLAEAALKISALLALAAIAASLMKRRSSAASRHLVWMLAVVAALAMPLATAVVPVWRIPVRHVAATAPASIRPQPVTAGEATGATTIELATADLEAAAAIAPTSWLDLALAGYAAAVILLLLRLAVEHRQTRQLVARAADITDPDWLALLARCAADIGVRRHVRLVRTHEQAMPMACGLVRSIIVIPSIADTWDASRRRAVLLHELAHVKRFDCLTQTLAEIAVALYWAHPATWWVARRLRIEREQACDDRVLAAGAEADDYAAHLLELAYSLGGSRRPVMAVSMAHPRQLEGRLAAVLDRRRNRATPGAAGRLTALAGAAIVVVGIAAATPVDTLVAAADQAAPNSPPAQAKPAEAAPGAAGNEAVESSPAGFVQLPPGTWELRRGDRPGRLDLRLRVEHASVSRDISAAAFSGLAEASITEPRGLSRFALKREAGVFTFEGVLRGNTGGGMFSFTPSAVFADALVKRGLTRPTPGEMQTLALADIDLAFLEELTKQGYAKPNLSQVLNAAQHGVNTDYVQQMAELGYRLGTVDALIRQRDHGVSPQFIRELRAQGLDLLSADDLVRARDHGLSPEYVRELRQLGYGPLTLTQLTNARDHGISPEYVREMRQLGYGRLTLEELAAARDHGISPDYVRDLRQLGFGPLTLDQLADARNHGISPDYAHDLERLGYKLSLADLTRARDHGVSVEYIKDLAALGYARLSLEELLRMRDHGISPEWLRTVTANHATPLSIDVLVSLRDRGVDSPAALSGPVLKSWNMKAAIKAWLDRWLS